MKHILFLMTDRQRRKQTESDAFVDLLQAQDVQATIGGYHQLSYLVGNDVRKVWFNGQDLASFDMVYFRGLTDSRGLAATAAFYLQEQNVPFIDQEVATNQSFNKLQQMYMLSRQGVNVPTTFFGEVSRLQALLDNNELQFPLVVKGKVASRGRDNYLVHDAQQLQTATADKGQAFFIVQQAIPNDGDYRVVVLGGKAVFAMYRQRQNNESHLNNTSQGAVAHVVDLTAEPLVLLVPFIEQATAIFGRDVAGVDVILHKHTGEYAILEVNRSPQLTTGAHVDKKMAAFAAYLKTL